jgi:hypothetical protein
MARLFRLAPVGRAALPVAKTQDLVFCFPLAILGYRLLPSAQRRRPLRLLVAASFLALFAWAVFSNAYRATLDTNVAVTLRDEIVPNSPHPERDRAQVEAGATAQRQLTRIAWFYARHSVRWWRTADRRMKEAFSYLPEGNFEAPLHGVCHTFSTWSEWKKEHYPRALSFWVVLATGYLLLLSVKWRYIDGTLEERDRSVLNAVLVFGCALEYAAVITFEANGTAKHLHLFNAMTDLVGLLAVLDLGRTIKAAFALVHPGSLRARVANMSGCLATNLTVARGRSDSRSLRME